MEAKIYVMLMWAIHDLYVKAVRYMSFTRTGIIANLDLAETVMTTTSAEISLASAITSVGRPNNPAQRALEALFTNKLTSEITMTNEDWKEKEEQFLADMNQLDYDHKIEYVAGQPFSRVLIQHPAQGRVALIINIMEQSKSIDESKADEFTDALKDL